MYLHTNIDYVALDVRICGAIPIELDVQWTGVIDTNCVDYSSLPPSRSTPSKFTHGFIFNNLLSVFTPLRFLSENCTILSWRVSYCARLIKNIRAYRICSVKNFWKHFGPVGSNEMTLSRTPSNKLPRVPLPNCRWSYFNFPDWCRDQCYWLTSDFRVKVTISIAAILVEGISVGLFSDLTWCKLSAPTLESGIAMQVFHSIGWLSDRQAQLQNRLDKHLAFRKLHWF